MIYGPPGQAKHLSFNRSLDQQKPTAQKPRLFVMNVTTSNRFHCDNRPVRFDVDGVGSGGRSAFQTSSSAITISGECSMQTPRSRLADRAPPAARTVRARKYLGMAASVIPLVQSSVLFVLGQNGRIRRVGARSAFQMNKFALTILLALIASPACATTYYLAPASGGGNDSNNGTSASTPWLTPNHAVNCGDVIIAAPSTAYAPANFLHDWGSVTCPEGNNVAWLKCARFDECKISGMTSAQAGLSVSASYWGVQGFEVDGTAISGACFLTYPIGNSPITIHHIVYANDIANGCGGGGFSFNPATQSKPTTAGVDYVAVVGNIAYNSARTSLYCATGIEVYEPVASDSLPGTHIYVAGNFSYANIEPSVCGNMTPGDGEGIEFDTWDGSQTGTPVYSQQGVIDNNMLLSNGGPGAEVYGNSAGTAPHSNIYVRQNTAWGNNSDSNEVVPAYVVGEILTLSAVNVQVFNNIAATNAINGGAGSQPIYAYWVSQGNGTDIDRQNLGYAVGGTVDGVYSSTGFAYGLNNLFGTNPTFASAMAPGAPSCGSFAGVPACMATVIANFTPTAVAAKPYGYQIPSASQIYDPLFPQWLCNVNLPSGLVTMGCLSVSSLPSPPTNLTVN
jgi:hypothetical protein